MASGQILLIRFIPQVWLCVRSDAFIHQSNVVHKTGHMVPTTIKEHGGIESCAASSVKGNAFLGLFLWNLMSV